MPSLMTHSYFMQDIYNKLDENIKSKIILNDAKIFAQGPDIFYFYNMCIGKKAKKYKTIGNTMHKKNVNLYFQNIINYIKENNLEKNKQCLTFLYGSIAHFVLDSVIHPFIYYKTGLFQKDDYNTQKYNGLHQEMEYFLDAYMIYQKEKIEATNFKMYKTINNIKLSYDTINMINNVIKDTYNYDYIGKNYEKCVKDMKKIYKFFKYDHYGIKKIIINLLNKFFLKKLNRKKKTTLYFKHNSKNYYLNLEKNNWNHPVDLKEIYNYSFIDLYTIALDKGYNIINEINKILDNKNSTTKIDNLINNLSYFTGKDCKDKRKMKYFEF